MRSGFGHFLRLGFVFFSLLTGSSVNACENLGEIRRLVFAAQKLMAEPDEFAFVVDMIINAGGKLKTAGTSRRLVREEQGAESSALSRLIAIAVSLSPMTEERRRTVVASTFDDPRVRSDIAVLAAFIAKECEKPEKGDKNAEGGATAGRASPDARREGGGSASRGPGGGIGGGSQGVREGRIKASPAVIAGQSDGALYGVIAEATMPERVGGLFGALFFLIVVAFCLKALYGWVFAIFYNRKTCLIIGRLENEQVIVEGRVSILGLKGCRFTADEPQGTSLLGDETASQSYTLKLDGFELDGAIEWRTNDHFAFIFTAPLPLSSQREILELSRIRPRYSPPPKNSPAVAG